jgi:hypothetical protein
VVRKRRLQTHAGGFPDTIGDQERVRFYFSEWSVQGVQAPSDLDQLPRVDPSDDLKSGLAGGNVHNIKKRRREYWLIANQRQKRIELNNHKTS